MPELPEVETSRRGIAPHILGKTFKQIIVRQPKLRWPVPDSLISTLPGLALLRIERRGKYLLLTTKAGTLLLHLGMSGNLRICDPRQPLLKHDHADFIFTDDTILRFNDQRRFGVILWTSAPVEQHALLAGLGPEPLSEAFNAEFLLQHCQNRRIPIKSLIMDSHIVVGVGNIYASESLFLAGLHPNRPAGELDLANCQWLCESIKTVLQRAIEQGGTTLRDFINAQGKPGYFQQSLSVYGRAGLACSQCAEPIQQVKIGQRASYFCATCQT
ncbi:MAG: bifunctional DNA-formamidopyrimidine glycosylase/DNA-(apurinic or apyrimidinic site) lyase [Methylomonas sp.]|jgi:formamidopyrimidine-DNA glycosylase|uniref:bifunctional DNA-formamidopyrimidine glycosylase/DNA-(apurinic or apyrimidinic site) lyase n=1 Tax=Methylomonas sp. TaxID=418 RepID=UPI0025FA2425|nr:bifunctional DNA-formamidopyrimidine glycosylase/DNA-(apurinic or apyrimidinic site) lyase [Methylomonas sp.]MCK9608630.1 bifunctional DNA-formamidopyrimidine glycosylase/DNA-(apurinic or apyrimidinic site) lyase [Methylomonas sp.]